MKYWRLLITILVMCGLTALLIVVIPRFGFELNSISDALFVVGIIVFLPSLLMRIGAFEVFHGMGYFFRLVFNRDTKKEYPTYKDYKETKTVERSPAFFNELLVASTLIIIAGIITALIAIG